MPFVRVLPALMAPPRTDEATPSPNPLAEKVTSPSGIIQLARSGTSDKHFRATMEATSRYPDVTQASIIYDDIVPSDTTNCLRFSIWIQITISNKSNKSN